MKLLSFLFAVFTLSYGWNWPWETSQVEQTGLINTIVKKMVLSERDERNLHSEVVIGKLTEIIGLLAVLIVLFGLVATINVYGFLAKVFKRKVEKKSRSRSAGVFEFGKRATNLESA